MRGAKQSFSHHLKQLQLQTESAFPKGGITMTLHSNAGVSMAQQPLWTTTP
jgi:hypothetical protein